MSAADVTNEMGAQAKLEDTNARLRRACELAGMGYWTNDLTNFEMRWSSELYKMFECDPSTFELSLASVSAMFHPDDRRQFNPQVFTQLEENKVNESEQRIVTSSGKLKWILERLYLTKDDHGVPVKLEGIALDITKRKLHEQEIWESHERFKILSDATFEAIVDWDLKTDTVMWGEGFRTMFGYELKNCTKRLWVNGIHPDDRKSVLFELLQTMRDPKASYFNSEFRFIKADGTIAFVQHRGVFIRDANGRVTRALAAMTDLTETISRMRKIEQQNEVLRDIAWTQSHVVRAPLANIIGIAGLLKENYNQGNNDQELINHLSDSAGKLDGIIREIVRKSEQLDHM